MAAIAVTIGAFFGIVGVPIFGALVCQGPDFPEGVRAVLVDKSRDAAWQPSSFADVDALLDSYYDLHPDPADPDQAVSFGTSGHRGNSLKTSFNEAHILATTQAIVDHRRAAGIDGPLFLGRDTHALSEPAFLTALEEALLSRFGWLHGAPPHSLTLRHDNGLVFGSRQYRALVKDYGLTQEYTAPYTPEQNGLCERFIRSFKEECAWLHRFSSLAHARSVITNFIRYFNTLRPHQALSYKSPSHYHQKLCAIAA